MARSITFSGSFGGDPLRALEKSRADESRALVSKRDRATWGNAPIPEQPRRMTKTLEDFLAEEGATKGWSEARKAAEALFVAPAKGGDHE
ncbi:hypothetical protein [Paraburkholderia sp. RL18-085-BIA-A]|uniref:hypothetical protein n=1 Tax=Paraburkholderia sp. RL18-085-BIA-A TaxID=3031633 RepID=UPI0038BB655A